MKEAFQVFIVGAVFVFIILLLFSTGVFQFVEKPVLVNKEEFPLVQEASGDVYLIPLIGEENNTVDLDFDQQFFIIPHDREIKILLYFREGKRSLKRLWNGSEAKLVVTTPFSAAFEGKSRSKSWGKLLLSQGTAELPFTPWLKVNFSIEREYYHQWIDATAEMDIVYPSFSGGAAYTGFTNQNSHLKRDIKLFVVSPGEHQMLEKRKKSEE